MADTSKEVVTVNSQPGLEPVLLPPNGVTHPAPGVVYAPAPDENRVCGLRKVTLILTIAIAALIAAIIGVAVGLGVGLTQTHRSEPASTTPTTSAAQTTTSISTSGESPTSIATPSSTIPGTSTSTSTPSSVCPGANGTVLTTNLGSQKYRVHCDSDFSGDGKQTLSSTITETFEDCLNLCNTMNWFQDRTDVGCTYNVEGTGGQTPGTCWCLGGTGEVVENVGNDAAVPI